MMLQHAVFALVLVFLSFLPSSSFTLRPFVPFGLSTTSFSPSSKTQLHQSNPNPTSSPPPITTGRRYNYRVSHTSVSTVYETVDVRTDDMWYENPVYDRPWEEESMPVVEDVKKAVFVASTVGDEERNRLKSANIY
ncbi:hypothetical protein TrST_g3384 [Triparma strigata]|uniref:Uncharacterized protein n=2 Tax=Triparma TaxID=722752 RepID=A0A9W7BWA3_9STRA|nr:hypothetical protein TrST_g3384 [Triparma strigata]